MLMYPLRAFDNLESLKLRAHAAKIFLNDELTRHPLLMASQNAQEKRVWINKKLFYSCDIS